MQSMRDSNKEPSPNPSPSRGGNGLHNLLHGRRAFEEINSFRRGGISIQEQTATDHPGDLDVHLLCFRPCCVENAELHAGYSHSRCRDPHVVCSVLPSRPSGSMLPEYRRGDVLLIDNRFHAIQIADIVVYNIPGRNIPIVHRVHVIHNPYLL